MGKEWFHISNGNQFGPITGQALKLLADKGELLPTDAVWKEGMKTGKAASKIIGLFTDATEPQPVGLRPSAES